MMADFTRNRIAKIRNDMCYSKENLNKKGITSIKDNEDTSAYNNWVELR